MNMGDGGIEMGRGGDGGNGEERRSGVWRASEVKVSMMFTQEYYLPRHLCVHNAARFVRLEFLPLDKGSVL